MRHLAKAVGKGFLLWILLLVGQAAGGILFFRSVPPTPNDGPLSAGQALLLVSLIDAIILLLLISQSRLRGWKLGLTLGGLLFGVQVFHTAIEALIFNADVHMASGLFVAIGLSGLLRDSLAALAIALLWRGTSEPSPAPPSLAWKAPAIAVLYVACYFGAGEMIAWQSPAVRAFYAHAPQLNAVTLVALQFGRGLVWAGLAWLLFRGLAGPVWRRAVLTGVSLSGLMIPLLLFPNAFMPWPVRAVHMVEVGISNFVFGVLAIAILHLATGETAPAPKVSAARSPTKPTSLIPLRRSGPQPWKTGKRRWRRRSEAPQQARRCV